MIDEFLNRTILQILSRTDTGLREKTLAAEATMILDRVLTTNEFIDALNFLHDKMLISDHENLIGDKIWCITEMGLAALRGA